MALGVALFSVLNGAVKDLAETFPVNQIAFFRNFFALAPLLILTTPGSRTKVLRTRRFGLHVALAVAFTASMIMIFLAYSMMPLSDATVIAFSQPLIVILIAGLWGREKPKSIEWLAVTIGIFGVGIMIQPSGEGNLLGGTLALGGAVFGAFSMVLQRELSAFDSSWSITFYVLALSSLLLMPTLAVFWTPPTASQWVWLVGMGIASGFCQFVTVSAFYHASASVVAPITYSKIFWAIIIGFLWFGDVPSLRALLGTGIVLLSAAIAFKAASDVRSDLPRSDGHQ